MGKSSRRLEAGLPKEETQRMSGNRWDQRGEQGGRRRHVQRERRTR